MLNPNPIIEREVRIHAIRVLSAAMIVRWRARSVRSSARIVPLSFGAVSTTFMQPSFQHLHPATRAGVGYGLRHDRRPVLADSEHAEHKRHRHRDQRDRKEREAS